MAVEKKKKEIDALGLTPRKQSISVWEASDGTVFTVKKEADLYEKKIVALGGFKMYFSERRGNLRLGNESLNKILCPMEVEKDYTFDDCFWLRFDSPADDEKILRKFCSTFYKASLGSMLTNEDEHPLTGWVYIMVINTHNQSSNRWYWISLGTMKKRIKIMENSFPDNVDSLAPLGKDDSLLDFD